MTRILILGGTREATELAAKLVSEGHDVTTSLAGRTREPKPIAGHVRTGGFGGVDGLVAYLQQTKTEKLIDATHPFATQISANAEKAAKRLSLDFQIIERAPWQKHPDDIWTEVRSLDHARDEIPSGARVLLALGSQHIDMFKTRADVFFLVRMVDKPSEPLPLPDHQLILGKPSTDRMDEMNMLKDNRITHIVCRNSGGKGAYAKIEAARTLGLPVIIMAR